MYTKKEIMKGLMDLGIKSDDTLLVHSSMKAIGEVEGGADTVLDALIDYMSDGLLILPTHTWRQIDETYNTYNPETEPSCVGVLTNLFLQRPNVYRSLHPTHSVAAIGKEANAYVLGDERLDTPCAREGCFGRLYDKKAKILFLGCDLKKNTFLHSVEEWANVSNRITDTHELLKIVKPSGEIMDRPSRRHRSTCGDVSENYDKMLEPLMYKGIARTGIIGDAKCTLCDTVEMADLTMVYLAKNPQLFADDHPIPTGWYKE